jgi:hypothetical protein
MPRLDPVAVLAAVESWIWTPADAHRVETGDYLLVAFPPYLPHRPRCSGHTASVARRS